MLDSRVATTPPVPPLRRGSAEHRSCSFPEARLLAPTVGRAPPTRHWFESLSRCRDVSTQVELLEPKAIDGIVGLCQGVSIARSWLAAPDLVLSPQIRGTGQRAHPARDVLRRCYTGYPLLCQGEILSKF